MDESITRLPVSPEKPAPYAISSSFSETAKNDDEEFKTVHQSHGEVLETSWKLNSCENRSNENASIEHEVSRYQTCNRVTALQGDKNDADFTTSNNRCGIHEDLLFEIMLWLPVTSLLRFRSICRLWCSLIDSSTFITQHYNHNRDKSCLLAHQVGFNGGGYDPNFCLLSGNKYEMYSKLDYEQPWYSVSELTVLNSCNGIVSLLEKKSGNVALWNPATRQLRTLPESSIYHQRLSVCDESSLGFGFDVRSNDFKVVRILYCHYEKENTNIVEVYSLRTDSCRIIHKDDVLPFQYINGYATTCKNGTCFWIGYARHDDFSPILVSFDLNNEVFETTLLPGTRDPHPRYCSVMAHNIIACDHSCCIMAHNALDLLDDKLCYIKDVNLGPSYMDQKYVEIWMLDDYGVKEHWKKICKFGPIGPSKYELPYVLGFSKNREFLLQCYKDRHRFFVYDILYLSNFDARGDYVELQDPNPVITRFVHYSESLVSLKREDGGTYK